MDLADRVLDSMSEKTYALLREDGLTLRDVLRLMPEEDVERLDLADGLQSAALRLLQDQQRAWMLTHTKEVRRARSKARRERRKVKP